MRLFSYDYEEFIEELKEDIEDEILTPDSMIQILRGRVITGTDYDPIIDWYYNQIDMIKTCTPEPDDEEYDIIEKKAMWNDYLRNAPNLVLAKVSDVLAEMEDLNRII